MPQIRHDIDPRFYRPCSDPEKTTNGHRVPITICFKCSFYLLSSTNKRYCAYPSTERVDR